MIPAMSASSPKSKTISLSRVPVEAIVDLRHQVLRQGLPREAALFDGDNAESACHWGAFIGDRLIGCVTLHASRWENDPAWQLRGMAVAERYQKLGIGCELLRAVDEHVASQKERRILWCNARVPAAAFYQKFGWQIVSEVFEIPTAGPHVRMIKRAAK